MGRRSADQVLGLPPQQVGDRGRHVGESVAAVGADDHVCGAVGEQSIAGLRVGETLRLEVPVSNVAPGQADRLSDAHTSEVITALFTFELLVGIGVVVQDERLARVDSRGVLGDQHHCRFARVHGAQSSPDQVLPAQTTQVGERGGIGIHVDEVRDDPVATADSVQEHMRVEQTVERGAQHRALARELVRRDHGVADVDDLGDEVEEPSIGVANTSHGEVAPHHRAVGTEVTLAQTVGIPATLEHVSDEGQVRIEVLRVGHGLPRGAAQGGLVSTEQVTERGADLDETAVGIDEAHADRGVGHGKAETCLGLTHALQQVVRLRDVPPRQRQPITAGDSEEVEPAGLARALVDSRNIAQGQALMRVDTCAVAIEQPAGTAVGEAVEKATADELGLRDA